mmetsp:Transcript_4885/g.8848  ORF Transcript_4885/g.8848 Transcript_4885/m.8848 type:complete len:205 (-) Transcript_4885:808-1422(-)
MRPHPPHKHRRRSSHGENQQAGRHDDHAEEEAQSGNAVLGVVAQRSWQQVAQRDVHHHAAHEAKHNGICQRCHAVPQDEVAHHATDGLGDAGEKGPEETLPLAARGVVDRHRDADALRDVVQGDRDGQSRAGFGLSQRRDEGGQALREVVDGNSESGHYAHFVKARVMVVAIHDLLHVFWNSQLCVTSPCSRFHTDSLVAQAAA